MVALITGRAIWIGVKWLMRSGSSSGPSHGCGERMTEERAQQAKERIVEHALTAREKIESDRIAAKAEVDAWLKVKSK